MAMILILDDSPAMLMNLAQILSKAGHEVTTGLNGKEGIAELNGGLKPAVILTDLNMPEMDGIEFIKEARKSAASKFTPIIVLSGDADGRKRDEARAAAPPAGSPSRPSRTSFSMSSSNLSRRNRDQLRGTSRPASSLLNLLIDSLPSAVPIPGG